MVTIKNLPNKTRHQILKKLEESKGALVLRTKRGLIVYDPYERDAHAKRMRKMIRQHKPWLKRRKSVLGPIGSQPLGTQGDLSRTSIYEDRQS